MLTRRFWILFAIFLTTSASALGYFYFRSQIADFIDQLTGAKRIANIFVCPGSTYINSRQGYKICYPKEWYTQEFGYSQLSIGFDQFPIPSASEYGGVFMTSVYRETSATLLTQYLTDLENPTTTAATVDGVPGIQVSGALASDHAFFPKYRQTFTVLEKLGRTYSIQLLSAPDMYEANLALYNDFVGSLKFLPQTASAPWGKDIFLTSPWPGDSASCSFRVAGSAKNAFENTLVVKLKTANDSVLLTTPITYNAPEMGELGYFDQAITYTTAATSGTLEVYHESAKDGSIVDLVSVPLTFQSCP